jgi:hypothetical protein
MASDKFATEIKKTGFELEYRASEVFRQHGWTVISNKYYIDDLQGTVREIDLIAYKTSKVQHFRVATIVVVSCKRSERDAWVLLAKDIAVQDPNIDWRPLHTWSNDLAMQYMLRQSELKTDYAAHVASSKCATLYGIPKRHVFAFQEMHKETGKANNDKNIFDAVTSLMKAQFNLMSVVETDLIRLDFGPSGDITPVDVDEELYVARYIIAKEQTFSRINFVKFDALTTVLLRYDDLHEANLAFFDRQCERFYEDAVRVYGKTAVFMDDFRRHLAVGMSWRLEDDEIGHKVETAELSWSEEDAEVLVHVPVDGDYVERMNDHASLRAYLSQLLERYYRFKGKSRFDVEQDIPF